MGTEPFNVQVAIQVAWGDLDSFQHVNNTVFLRWFETARIQYFMNVGFIEVMEETGIGPILAETRCRFRRPVSFPDEILASARVTNLAEDRFTMLYQAHSREQNELVAEGDGRIVCVDYRRGGKASLPPNIRQAIERLEGKD